MRRALVVPVPIRRLGAQENPGSLWLRMWGSEIRLAKVLIPGCQEKLLNAKPGDRTVNRHR